MVPSLDSSAKTLSLRRSTRLSSALAELYGQLSALDVNGGQAIEWRHEDARARSCRAVHVVGTGRRRPEHAPVQGAHPGRLRLAAAGDRGDHPAAHHAPAAARHWLAPAALPPAAGAPDGPAG